MFMSGVLAFTFIISLRFCIYLCKFLPNDWEMIGRRDSWGQHMFFNIFKPTDNRGIF